MDVGKSLLVVFLLLCVGFIVLAARTDVLATYLILILVAPALAVLLAVTEAPGSRLLPFIHHASRGVALVWAIFWWVFRTAALRGRLLHPGELLASALIPALFSISAALLWQSEDVGGTVLTIEGLGLQALIMARQPQFLQQAGADLPSMLAASVLLAAPAELAGLLSLAAWRRRERQF